MTEHPLARDAVLALQALALNAFDAVLARQPCRLDAQAITQLNAHLWPATSITPSGQASSDHAARLFLMKAPAAWSAYQADLLPRPRGLTARLLSRRKHRTRIGKAQDPAPYLLAALGQSAWSGLHFRRQAARRLHTQLRQEVLMSPGMTAPPVLSTPFWWLLLSASSVSEPSLHAACNRESAKALDASGWAGFWDQYLLHRAGNIGRSFPAAIEELPLLKSSESALAADAENETAMARPGWRNEAPDWAAALIGKRI